MTIENSTIQDLITAMLVIIPLGAAARIVYCAIAIMGDEEKKPEYKRRIRNILGFVVIAEVMVGLVNVLINYYQQEAIALKTRVLYVPANVSTRNEVWKGLSIADAVKALLLTAAAAAVALAAGLAGAGQLPCIIGVCVVGACSVGALQKFENNLSMTDYAAIMLKFAREQKRFIFVYRR